MPFYLNVRNDGIELLKCNEIFTTQRIKEIYCEKEQKNNVIKLKKYIKPMKYIKEIQILINKSKREFKSAELLFKDEDFEGLSKCYYSMFHSAQAALLTKDIDPFHFQHKSIVSKFGELFVKTGIF